MTTEIHNESYKLKEQYSLQDFQLAYHYKSNSCTIKQMGELIWVFLTFLLL